jgi:hypothetical protein
VGSVDAPALPVVLVEEREAPGHPLDLEMIMALDLGSVDALALLEVSVAELEAPGHPPVLALDLAEDLGSVVRWIIHRRMLSRRLGLARTILWRWPL